MTTNKHTATLTFHGGAGAVTGAHFLLETGGARIAIDCGLIQGVPRKRDPNREPFPYDPHELDVLIVTHAHTDHIGRIPKLVADGFSGPIYSTAPTRDIVALMYEDALSLMALRQKEEGIEPLYTEAQARQALAQWQTHEYHEPFAVGDGATAQFLDAGHILGSAMVALERGGRRLVVTGDLGNSPDPLLRDTEPLPETHYLLMESVYGNRAHQAREERREVLRQHIEDTRARSGVLLVPVFSLHRTQVFLSELNELVEDGVMEPIDIYLDSPLAIRITDIYRNYPQYFNETARARLERDADLFAFPGLTETLHTADSREIQNAPNPKVILAGSGMSHGGRIQSHEQRLLGERDTTLLLVGYQTLGSPGRRLLDGEKRVKLDDEWVTVRARVAELTGYSGHKDRDNLVDFAATSEDTLAQVFVAMGEPRAALFLAQRLHDFLGLQATAPAAGDTYELDW